ncbi:hypothetical protein IMZ48_33185 [Candidatus Bathyarchaeota archaeon]|nr:hypothetical protein [Candidatus Bathyarchaeota archaeon]
MPGGCAAGGPANFCRSSEIEGTRPSRTWLLAGASPDSSWGTAADDFGVEAASL